MNIDTKYYEIDGLKIEWGKPLNDVRPMLEDFEKFKPYGGWPNIRCKCSSIFGLPATEFEVRAPFEDRPVLQVQYEIAPIKPGFFKKQHSPYLTQLVKVLGEPLKSENLYYQPDLKKDYLSSAVVFSATWLFRDIRISLSVYGGTRSKDSGLCAAGIFIDWIDEINASKPYRERAELFEKSMLEHIGNDIVIKKFKLQNKQRPFRVVHYELNDPYIAEKDSKIRASQMSLYKRELYQTPLIISAKLNDDEIGYYKIADFDRIFISNKWDTIYLTPNQNNEMTYWEILPARGPGGRQLDLKELQIEDSKNSLTLLDLVAQIEADIKQVIERRETYDD
ncbi:MAG: hypothetical protein IPP69_08925 [Flavobacteriales bacterium]|nr:hypothetical protein [Flavobacteriales bacterium]